jgi:hypothetical protein
MKFFEVQSPYYALVKAEDEKKAIEAYRKYAPEAQEIEIKEVERDYALVVYSAEMSQDVEKIPVHDILREFRNEYDGLLVFDVKILEGKLECAYCGKLEEDCRCEFEVVVKSGE